MSNNFFENVGKKLDQLAADGPKAFNRAKRIVLTPVTRTPSYGDVVNSLIAQAGNGVEVQTIDSKFEYIDIVRWVEEHAVGDTVYIANGKTSTESRNVLCVFFGREDRILLGIQYPKICYFYQRLNPSIADLFANGKNIYVQHIK